MKHVTLVLVAAGAAIPLVAGLATAGFMHTAAPISRTGKVSATHGVPDLSVGDTCSVDVAAEARADLNCRVTVRCAERTLFGGAMLGGYATCGVSEGRYDSASDPAPTARDGDPIVQLDVGRRFARVADARYEVQIALAD